MKRRSKIGIGVLLALMVAAALPLRRVSDSSMAHTILPGEWVWIVPGRVRKADVVALADPLDPSRVVLRRAVAGPGDTVRYDEDGLRVNGRRIHQTDMGKVDGFRVYKEVIWSRPPPRANTYFVRILANKPVKYELPGKITVPEGHWYLLADDRDESLDSRWWGPIAESAIKGVVRFRIGHKDAWRSRFQLMYPAE